MNANMRQRIKASEIEQYIAMIKLHKTSQCRTKIRGKQTTQRTYRVAGETTSTRAAAATSTTVAAIIVVATAAAAAITQHD